MSVKGALSQSREKIKDFQFCLPILPMYLPLKFPNGQFPLKIPGPISQATLEQNKKNKKNSPVVGFTRGWERGTSLNGQKIKDFQSCLPILPAYLPLKFPNGQFPLKIPGPISQAKPKPIKKKLIVPFRKEKKLNGGVAILLKKIAFG